MRPAIASIINGVKEDSASGCSEMTSKLLQNLRSLLNTNRSMARGEWQEFARELRNARPGMAPFYNLAEKIDAAATDTSHINWNDSMAELIDRTLQEEMNAASEIADKFLGLVQGGKILTMSYSGTIMSAILRQVVENDVTVYVTESQPMGEGAITGKKLASHKVHVNMIPDSMVGAIVDDIDCCIVGADSLTKTGVVNKVGTRAMAATCMTAGKTFYVLCSELKIANLDCIDLMRTSKVHDGFTDVSQKFEVTPYELVDTIVTNKRVLSPNSLVWK